MSVTFRVLGSLRSDNALFVQVDSGQAIEYLMFDCGEGCFSELSCTEKQEVDHLFFSHLHMDHVAGFDSFFRCNFNREAKVNSVWGPPGTVKTFYHRFRSFLWNLHGSMSGTWRVADIHPGKASSSRFELREAFATEHVEGERQYDKVVWEGIGAVVEAITLDHSTPSIGYIVRERTKLNVDVERMAALGLKPGPWVKQLKDPAYQEESLEVAGAARSTETLRNELLCETPGDSVAYLTDFHVTEETMEPIVARLQGCGTLVCEAQYRHADFELARENFHMTAQLSATLAKRADVGQLVLIHFSRRYLWRECREMLEEARATFPRTRWAEHWNPRND